MADNLLVSVVVPTYNERENLPALVERLDEAMRGSGIEYELVIVDDSSPDGTADAALELSESYPIKVVVRPGRLGLASAVAEGSRRASGEVIVVMDADLQHPPEVVPKLVEAVRGGCDVAVASRYSPGGGTSGFPLERRMISRTATLMAHFLVGPSRRTRDPLSGFFAARAELLRCLEPTRPRGYKVLLDLLAQFPRASVCDVPFTFESRRSGRSKLGWKEIAEYLAQLVVLTAPFRRRISRRSPCTS
ncbi:MAG: polyprenol monophosphomannose synthase [Desulfurococcaceae archaeon]